MPPDPMVVFLPCHSLDDFPTWLDEDQADGLLSAWAAPWHPALLAAAGSPPEWASVDLPVARGPRLGIVPAAWDDRFAAQFDVTASTGSTFVRRTAGLEEIQRALAERMGLVAGDLPAEPWADDFRSLGLASLLAELLARRMRSRADLHTTGFSAAVMTAARAAVAGRDDDAKVGLAEAFDAISASRARYYPVDSYAIDLVLIPSGIRGDLLEAAVESPVPVAVAGTGHAIESIAATSPGSLASLRRAVAAGRVAPCGGLDTDIVLDFSSPEAILDSFASGIRRYRERLGAAPAAFARVGGGAAPLLVPLLAGLGIEGGIWSLFDGSALPDVGGGMIRWQAGGAAVDLLAARPLDAGSARTVLGLPQTLGDALDRDHVAAVLFAHYAGTASPWHALVRRIGGRTNLLGTFVTPRELARRTGGSGTPVSPEPDAFPPALPGATDATDAISKVVEAAGAEAAAIIAASAPLAVRLPASDRAGAVAGEPPRPTRWLSFAIPGPGRRDSDTSCLDNGLVHVEIHPRTGGLLAVRRSREAANRLSQQLAVRTMMPMEEKGRAGSVTDDRAVWTRMVADSVERIPADGRDAIVSTGRLVAADGAVAARFRQRVQLAESVPLALLDVEVSLEWPLEGPLLGHHLAARFAWHENEHVEIRRSLLTQSIVTERTRFTAPHFIEVVPDGGRFDATADRVAILTGGLPWHVLSTPHVIDSVLAGATAGSVKRRLAVGVGLRRPWDAALAVAAGTSVDDRVPGLPENVRLTVRELVSDGGRVAAARVGFLESSGQAGEVTIDWRRPVGLATAVDFTGAPRSMPAVAIDGTRTVVFLDRYQWLQLDVGFAG